MTNEDKVGVPDSFIKPVMLVDLSVNNDTVELVPSLIGGEEGEICPGDCVLQARLKNSEGLSSLHFRLSHLTNVHRTDLINLITEYVTLFSDTPSCTGLIEHDIDVGDATPIRQRYYRVSANKKKQLDEMVFVSSELLFGYTPY